MFHRLLKALDPWFLLVGFWLSVSVGIAGFMFLVYLVSQL